MSENKNEKFRADRFTWKDGDIKKEDDFPDENKGTTFWTYYACKDKDEKMRLAKEREKKENGGS